MKKLLFIIFVTHIYHTPALSFNFNFLKKKEIETLKKDIPVGKNSQINVINTEGSITIKPWNQQKVALEVQKKGTLEQLKATTIKSKVTNKDATLTTAVAGEEVTSYVHYTLRVPEDASISVTQLQGHITINGIVGNIDISAEQGNIDIKGSTGTVIAKTANGNITLRQRKLEEPNSIFLQAHKGNIELFLPRETRATLHATTSQGTILSDHPVTITFTAKLDAGCWERIKKDISGVLGNYRNSDELDQMKGASPITLETNRGKIQIKES